MWVRKNVDLRVTMDEDSKGADFSRALGRLEGKMDSVVAAVTAISASFESLEKGRLSRLEIAFATLKGETATESTATARWTSAIWSLGVTIGSVLILHFVFKL